ncbi:TIGR01244 family sulfur transferase [Cognatishimia sp. SS12]|uniref:TIGR01244 family sulfur transferase n=1 Tax=Cognatishimia sp. SS12 TaxID=2979465 RepID=UPI00232FDC22|nr:TIGR01244 family sulfur transferase [Cognatishimia sp. SS12]MDC0736802.1 TIGR01244 family sulfur transferase [Cognatishimia sp. SS12]
MDIREITPRYYVSPQIAVEDVSILAQLGFSCVICNRPDAEVPTPLQAAAMQQAAAAAGLTFVLNPLTHDSMTEEKLRLQRDTLEAANGKVLAYCASGTRSTVAWILGHAGRLPTDDLFMAAAKGGYQLDALRPQVDYLAQSGANQD